jgi:zinc protease
MRCRFLFLIPALFFAASPLRPAEPPAYFHAFTLENGLQVFVLEDPQDALVRVELCVRAGHSASSPGNTGFFPLFARLFWTTAADTALKLESAVPGISGIESACLADSARYRFSVPPAMCSRALSVLAECAAFPAFSDAAVSRELSRMKNEVRTYAASAEGFINSAIDSRVFSDSPWKHDSGIYPAVFSAVTPFDARSVLDAVAREFYTPRNAALFITGGIGLQDAEALVSRAFGVWKNPPGRAESGATPGAGAADSGGKKFVLVSQEFSPDFNQIVAQYAAPSKIHAAVASRALELSPALANLVSEAALGIPSPDYTNVSAAYKNGAARVIVQALPSARQNEGAAGPPEQAALAAGIVQNAALGESFFRAAVPAAKTLALDDYQSAFDNPQNLARALMTAWEERSDFFAGDKLIESISADEIAGVFNEPFIFLLAHTSVYDSWKPQLERAGFRPVTGRDASWWTRELYKNAGAAAAPAVPPSSGAGSADASQDAAQKNAALYYNANIGKFTITRLSNGIELIMHNAEERERVTIALGIAGGERASPENMYGLESVLVRALAENIGREIQKRARAVVEAETTGTYSVITIECAPQDAESCIAAACDAIIFGTITPVMADEAVYAARYDRRVNAVTADAQLEEAALRLLYKDTPDEKLYAAGEDILADVQFSAILNAYPAILDAARYRIVVTGRAGQDADRIARAAERTFGVMKAARVSPAESANGSGSVLPQFGEGSLAVKISRRFLTSDIPVPADGSAPLLVPTASFVDPLHVYLPAQGKAFPRSLFDALLFELEHVLASALAESEKPPAAFASVVTAAGWACVRFGAVSDRDAALALLSRAAGEVEANLAGENAGAYFAGVKSRWAARALGGTGTNAGMARLMLGGLYAEGAAVSGGSAPGAGAFKFLEDYLAVENSSATDAAGLLKAALAGALVVTAQ